MSEFFEYVKEYTEASARLYEATDIQASAVRDMDEPAAGFNALLDEMNMNEQRAAVADTISRLREQRPAVADDRVLAAVEKGLVLNLKRRRASVAQFN